MQELVRHGYRPRLAAMAALFVLSLPIACRNSEVIEPRTTPSPRRPVALPTQPSPSPAVTASIPLRIGSTATTSPPLRVILPDFFPGEADGVVASALWLDDMSLAVAYLPLIPASPEAEMTAAARPPGEEYHPELEWLQYDIEDGAVTEILAPIAYDPTFWERNGIARIADYPELYGYFSPSGEKVIFNVWHGSVFDAGSTTDILVQSTGATVANRVFQFGYSNVYIYRAQWNASEDTVYFTATYEGPAELFVANLRSGRTAPISESSDWDGVTEDTFRLSPRNDVIAAIDSQSRLILVSLSDGSVTVATHSYSSIPIWGSTGNIVYYWHGSDWMEASEFCAIHTDTLDSVAIFDRSAIAQSLRSLGQEIGAQDEAYLLGGIFSVSPSSEYLFIQEGMVGPVIVDLQHSLGAQQLDGADPASCEESGLE